MRASGLIRCIGGVVPMGVQRTFVAAGTVAVALGLASAPQAAAASPAVASAGTISAAPGGSGAACTAVRPCSLAQAQLRVRALDRDLRRDLVVRLAPGDYRLARPLTLDARDSGSNGHRVIWQGSGRVVF